MASHVPVAQSAKPLFSYRKYWAQRFGVAPFLPMSRQEMDVLGWDSCDVILVTGLAIFAAAFAVTLLLPLKRSG